MISCTCDIPEKGCNLFVVGQYTQLSGNQHDIWIDSRSLSELSAMKKLASMDVAMILSNERDNDVSISDWRTCHLFVSKPI